MSWEKLQGRREKERESLLPGNGQCQGHSTQTLLTSWLNCPFNSDLLVYRHVLCLRLAPLREIPVKVSSPPLCKTREPTRLPRCRDADGERLVRPINNALNKPKICRSHCARVFRKRNNSSTNERIETLFDSSECSKGRTGAERKVGLKVGSVENETLLSKLRFGNSFQVVVKRYDQSGKES